MRLQASLVVTAWPTREHTGSLSVLDFLDGELFTVCALLLGASTPHGVQHSNSVTVVHHKLCSHHMRRDSTLVRLVN